MNEVRKKIKDLKETLKNDMKSLNLDKGIFGSLGFGGIAIIIVNYLTGLALFNTIGGLGFFATLGAFGISKFASAYRKASKLKKYEQHLDNINARGVKADKKSNDKRHAAIKNHEKSLADKKKITGFLDKILNVSMGLSLGWMLLLRTSPLALLMPIVATASAILKIKPSIDEADLEARIKCIQSDLDVAKIKPAATPASQGVSQKVLTQGTKLILQQLQKRIIVVMEILQLILKHIHHLQHLHLQLIRILNLFLHLDLLHILNVLKYIEGNEYKC